MFMLRGFFCWHIQAKRLAEDLGPAWLYVLDVVNCLDRFLELPGAKWKSDTDKPDEGLRRRLDFFVSDGPASFFPLEAAGRMSVVEGNVCG